MSSGQTGVRSYTDTLTLKSVFGSYMNLICQHRTSVCIARQLLPYRHFVCNSLSPGAHLPSPPLLLPPLQRLGSVNSNVTKYVKNLNVLHVLVQTSMFNMLSSYIHYFIAGSLEKLSTRLHCPV